MAASAAAVATGLRCGLASWVPLLGVGCHVASSMIGYLTLPWVMTSELYPARYRGALVGLTTCLAQILTFAAVKSYPGLKREIGLEATLWGFSGAAFVGAVFALTLLPETRSRSLNDIEKTFAKVGSHGPSRSKGVVPYCDVRDVTLSKFAHIPEEHWLPANAYAYDNLALEFTVAEKVEKEKSMKTPAEFLHTPSWGLVAK